MQWCFATCLTIAPAAEAINQHHPESLGASVAVMCVKIALYVFEHKTPVERNVALSSYRVDWDAQRVVRRISHISLSFSF